MSERSRPRPPIWIRVFLPLTFVALYLPLVVMVVSSFLERNVGEESYSMSLRWYFEVVKDPVLWAALWRSFIVATVSSSIATVLGMIAALALDRWKFTGRWFLKALSTLSLILPELVLALSLLSWFALLQVHLSLMTVVIAHVTLTLPFVVMVIAARLKGLERSYDEAARDLGATELQILFKVTLPLLLPSLVSGFVLAFLLSFDDFIVTFYTNGAGEDTLPIRLYSMMRTGISPKIQALSSIMLLISVILIAFLVQIRGRTSFVIEQE